MKKFFTLFMVLVLTLSLTACSENPSKNDTQKEFSKITEGELKKEAKDELPNKEDKEPTKETEAPTEATIPETEPPTEPEPEPISYFDENTTMELSYVTKDNTMMSYILATPSTANSSETPLPLIVFLHGKGQCGMQEDGFKWRPISQLIQNWELTNFNAYVMSPSLLGNGWAGPYIKNQLQKTLNDFFLTHNVDRDKVIICGHSLGGIGTPYMAYELQDYFSAQVIFSGYGVNIPLEEIKIPTKLYCGMSEHGEDSNSVNYTKNFFMPVFGEENTFFLPTSHNDVLKDAFYIDEDKDGISDLMQWMFEQDKGLYN